MAEQGRQDKMSGQIRESVNEESAQAPKTPEGSIDDVREETRARSCCLPRRTRRRASLLNPAPAPLELVYPALILFQPGTSVLSSHHTLFRVKGLEGKLTLVQPSRRGRASLPPLSCPSRTKRRRAISHLPSSNLPQFLTLTTPGTGGDIDAQNLVVLCLVVLLCLRVGRRE